MTTSEIASIQTPCYLYDLEAFDQNVLDISKSVRKYYSHFRIGYSYKTNCYIGFLKEAQALGCYAEVVSPQEYDMALSIGIEAKDIIYNGVIPDFDNKLNVALAGGIVNLENWPEINAFIEYTNKHRLPLEVGVRVNFDLNNGLTSRFGLDVESAEFANICDFNAHPYLSFKCVHFQFGGSGGGLRTPAVFRLRVRKCVEVAKKIGARIVDIGGNIIGRLDESFTNQWSYTAPTMEEVCETIGQEMAECCVDGSMELIAECGSPVCSNAMHLLTTITNVNEVRGHTFVTCDCRKTDGGWSLNQFIPTHEHYGQPGNIVNDAMVHGCECREEDLLIRKYTGPANVGDKILIRNIGSYSYSIVNDFITPGCRAVYPIDKVIF